MSLSKGNYILLIGCITILLAAFMFWSLILGTVPITSAQVLSALKITDTAVSEQVDTIITQLRLPRVLLTMLTGAGLAIVGTLLQTTTRNELADPFLFGLSSGASAGVVFVITRFGEQFGELTLPLSAFVGGSVSAFAVLILFHISDSRRPEHLIVCGLSISFLFSALTSYLVFSGDQRAASSVIFWSLGGLGLARWDNLFLPLMSLILLSCFVAWRWKWLDGLLSGEQTAISLGVNVARLRTEAFICSALATSFLVSLTGVIGFVGLMVPHVARRIAGVKHLLMIPLAALLGAVLLCSGDMISRTLIEDQELPIGIITAGLGGFFIIILQVRRSSC
ncbi:iron ABC transporter permease [Serratia sp. UGAL515B_01]|uniref:FecCD family ABC transporter permease n=1 Tax=Serratia sp. UGAL515B_01 TaxID=2986763 RepID=UPI002955BA78|nr:iron ABC transporter permease [Serratia sp. UGAL515B_01]WON77707.1 iron ABC transporter permease [Serratia sp. UGAL515B_01]